MGVHSFSKSERLTGEKRIQELFSRGSSFNLYPFRVVYLEQPGTTGPCQVLFSVPARNFKRAVDRNKIKRRSREAFRLLKHESPPAPGLRLALVYTSRKIETFDVVKRAVRQILQRLSRTSA